MSRPKYMPKHSPPQPEEINALRKRAGLTMAGMAELLDVSTATVESWCAGRNPVPSPAWTLFKILVVSHIGCNA